MNRSILVSLTIAFATTAFAGCLGDGSDDLDSAIPRAVVSVTEVGGKIDTFLFDASGSSGRGLKFEWDFGDGQTATDAKVEHTYEFGSGIYDARLAITDASGVTDLWTEAITVGDGINLPPEAAFKPGTRYLAVGEAFTVDATATTDSEGDPLLYEWDFNFVMTEAEYLEFREAKANMDIDTYSADSGPEVSDDDGSAGSEGTDTGASAPVVAPDDLTSVLGASKSPGHEHGGSAPEISLFNGFRTSEEPVYTLEEGFPDPTRFYVKLTAIDIKGASGDILSEEIWPVEVVETKAPEFYDGSLDGAFTLGGPATVQESTPDTPETNEVYDDEAFYKFDIPSAIVEMYINVTWSQTPASEALANDVDMDVETPNGKTRSVTGPDESISLKLLAADEVGAGPWRVDLYGRQGADIQWTVSYWAKVDLNPFRELEADYVELERPDDDGF